MRLDNDSLIADLRRHISKNKKMPEFFSEIRKNPSAHLAKLANLINAINSADMQNEIFSDQNCMPYLIYLIENKLISFMPGITTYYYLMALAEFSEKQALKPEDKVRLESFYSRKLTRDYKIVPLVEEKKLTEEGKKYLEAVQFFFRKTGIEIN